VGSEEFVGDVRVILEEAFYTRVGSREDDRKAWIILV